MSAVRALRQVSSGIARLAVTRNGVGSVGGVLGRATVVSRMSGQSQWVSVRAFSGTPRVFGSGTSDVAVAEKLQTELQYEKETGADAPETPEFLKAFTDQGVWSIEDSVGNDEVALSRKFGNETIRLMFSIADMQSEEESEFENPEEENTSDEVHSYPLRVSMSMTKSNGPGALNMDMVCQEGHFIADNISFYSDAKLGTELTAEADWKRRGLYIGPQFDTLDVALQEEFEKFLQERGINENLALFIPEYAEWKEQHEYVKWLNNVKSFVEL
ncbi:hypothetical protein AX17_004629 [Amanita inopinata Kibby_2008]|nr:hypothetical protein AX17_004629 [Amanita inopinata Kibby_2008]